MEGVLNKDDAIRLLREEVATIEPGQNFGVRRMEPEDARGVARSFFAVYGEHYPFDTRYPSVLKNKKTIHVLSGSGNDRKLACDLG